MELAVDREDYGMLVEGDRGRLSFQAPAISDLRETEGVYWV